MAAPLLSVENLSVSFRGEKDWQPAVREVSFTVHKGETIGLVGESGSGKSVTSLSIMQLLPPNGRIDGGQICWHGAQGLVDLTKLSNAQMRSYRGNEIAMIFQEPMTSLNPVFTCGYQVAEAIRLHLGYNAKQAKERVLALFEQVELPDPRRIYRSYPHELSGGQKQRVMIAMALSCSPKLIIADEPTTALDVTVQKTILDLLQSLQSEIEAAIIFITHDLGVIGDIAERVVVMYQGEIKEEAPVEQLFTAPQHPYTRGLLACRPPLEVRPVRLPTIKTFMQQQEGGAWQTNADAYRPTYISPQEAADHLQRLQQQPPLLTVHKLSTWFPRDKRWWGKPTSYIKAVDEVSLEVFSGETLGLVGESGCGKTTLGRTLMRLVEATHGRVVFEGQEVLALAGRELRALRKKMQIIFQDPYSSLNPRMMIGKAIQEPMQVHHLFRDDKERKEKVFDLLEKVGLSPDHYQRYPHEFSGGQRQRICIARALAVEPKFIICDESVSALDVSVQAQVLNLLRDLQEEFNLTYIFISHDLSVVHFMADRIAVMKQGQIVEMGPGHNIYRHPSHPYTKSLIEAIPKGNAAFAGR